MDYSLGELASKLNLLLNGDPETRISGIASIENARAGDISFLSNPKLESKLDDCMASAIVLSEKSANSFSGSCLICPDPYVAFAKLAQLFDTTPAVAKGIDASASIAGNAVLGKDVCLAANVVIERGVVLEDGVKIGAGSFIGQGSRIGKDSIIYPNVTLYHNCSLGQNCTVHSSTVIGADGFGYANHQGEWIKIPQLGGVQIGDKVEIGAGVTIDRGALDNTVIESNVIIDDQVHIAHNCTIGSGTALAGATAIAGSTKIGRYNIIGGRTTINGHIETCDQVTITGNSMVVRSIKEPGTYSSGVPASKNRDWRRNILRVGQLDEMYKRINALEKKNTN
ncbi:UDP-3-O-(3-hydroxymyristoyl)glucosamine N-acyltransferase [Alginatibacterium sediminis]|uniref:UDP-3-O-acylglucosamine N-acyltransferase n=1 Tax=Alginatibacterium sediminis TaxID=2164068 RepID=A0A420E7Y8_9ALTE|nr:UDP-3-O-(3-hydroxymyristoyl)glucosamine N-acyltransferase [Alginatibacterium sediminis]RKF15503.1 UDP-3-O-(3-hydroxymyristoyl)glucosamine N-acyltransferase [Alginatibacterium sediminis]